MKSKSRILREKMSETGLAKIMATHSPLSGRLAMEAGFDGLWASGFELSALYGLPDVSLISMTQHLDMMRSIVEKVDLPVVADIDTGFGNAINVIHAVQQYERAGAAAVVIEDKSFPKVTSLIAGGRQDLLRIEEFQGKIDAACQTRRDPDFLVIARDEALIAGLGQDEALRRSAAYEAAGADMILIHSKQTTPDEIVAFSRAWNGTVPLVIVPTAYPQMTDTQIRNLGNIRMVIYGNHAIRASVAAMKETFAAILRDGGSQIADAQIAPVDEIFRLQDMDQVKKNEKKFLR
ncbi:MAG: phosphonopyruvate hydrolase [Alphaproteobacteria bacterium]|nr:phosphonopyruvate hydrolase [Alphaproteobacteria bacterium]